jgi:hypothetical protein
MKVFLSWSGDISHRVAMTFRNWLPSVIQSINPYVSSEDIDKGARWSTDIAKELENSAFGILCVTKDNINAPWLNFEAGALSKTMDKSFVSPFLFDIKRSEVNGPILQFQSTVFEKEDIKKLIFSLKKACVQDQLTDERLEKTFSVWYPSLEEELIKIKNIKNDHSVEDDKVPSIKDSAILEEILELTRINQKLIRKPEGILVETVTKIDESINNLHRKIISALDMNNHKRHYRNVNPRLFDEFLFSSMYRENYIGVQLFLSFLRDDYPVIYNVGNEVIEVLKSKKNKQEKYNVIEIFKRTIDIIFNHPVFRENRIANNKDIEMMCLELPRFFMNTLEEDT